MGFTTYTKDVGPLVTVTISMLCLICLCILNYALPKSALSWGFCYIYFQWRVYSSTVSELYLRLYWYVCASYKCCFIDMFAHLINGICVVMFVYVIQYNCWLYFILVFCSICLLCMCYSTTVSLLHLCLY